MDGVHDVGGVDGFGPVTRETREPVFHQGWEKRVFGIVLATMAQGLYNLDEMRHAIERMNPAEYLGSTYYEHWLAGLERMLIEKGKISREDIEARLKEAPEAESSAAPRNPALAEGLAQGIRVGAPSSRGKGRARFRVGARVRVRKTSPAGHTRCPRYVRGAVGTIERAHEKFVLPDAHAHGRGESPEIVYTVAFDGPELWGPRAAGRDRVYVDLFESYLEPARTRRR